MIINLQKHEIGINIVIKVMLLWYGNEVSKDTPVSENDFHFCFFLSFWFLSFQQIFKITIDDNFLMFLKELVNEQISA